MNIFQKSYDFIKLKVQESDVKGIDKIIDELPANDDFKAIFLSMQKNYLVLQERYTHDIDKKLRILEDWSKYARTLGKVRKSQDANEIEKANIIREEIEKRYQKLLGNEYVKPPEVVRTKVTDNQILEKATGPKERNKLKKVVAVIAAIFVFYDVWKITTIILVIVGAMIFGDSTLYGSIGSLVGILLAAYLCFKVYKLYPRWIPIVGILIISVILSVVPSIFATALQVARQKVIINLPVTVLPTSDGQTGLGMYEDKYPNSISISNASDFSNQIAAYGASYMTWVGPKGWVGKGGEGVDGNLSVDLYPSGGSPSEYGPRISYGIVPACSFCMLSGAAPYFTIAMLRYNSAYNTDGKSPIFIPPGLNITQISPTLVTYTLPETPEGMSVRGVAYYGPYSTSTPDVYYTGATFTLPQDQSNLSDFLLQTFINRMGLK